MELLNSQKIYRYFINNLRREKYESWEHTVNMWVTHV